MKYYFLTTGEEFGADIPTEMTKDLDSLEKEYDDMNNDDYFYIGIFNFDTETLKISEMKSKGYQIY